MERFQPPRRWMPAVLIAVAFFLGGVWVSAAAEPLARPIRAADGAADSGSGDSADDPCHHQPDFVPTEVTLSPPEPVSGDVVEFTATIENQGHAASANFTVRFELDNGTHLGDRSVAGLDAGASVEVTSDEWHARAGTHVIRVTADSNNQVNESDEHNNELEHEFQVEASGAGVDLSPDHQNATVRLGESVNYTIRVTNTGDREDTINLNHSAAPAGWSARLDHDAVRLEPGANVSVQLTVTAPVIPVGALEARIEVVGTSTNDPEVHDAALTTTTLRLP